MYRSGTKSDIGTWFTVLDGALPRLPSTLREGIRQAGIVCVPLSNRAERPQARKARS